MTGVNWVWVVLSSAAVGALVKGALDILVSFLRSKGQFKRDRANIATMIYESEKDGTKEKYEECVERYIEIYEKLEKVFKK